jgi:hypothetical protein
MRPIRWVVDSIVDRDVWDGERVDTLKAADVVAVLLRIRAPLMMGMDAAHRTKVMLGRVNIELIDLEMLCAFDDAKSAQRYRRNDGAPTPAIRAVAPARVNDAIGQRELKLDSSAMACGPVHGLNFHLADTFKRKHEAPPSWGMTPEISGARSGFASA